MARKNRGEVFDPNEVATVHCTQRVVRRAMLCGYDPVSGNCYEHRRRWIRDRLAYLAAYYAIDVLGYAVLNNHLHVVLRNRPDLVKTWSDREVAERIWYLFPKRKEADGRAAEPTRPELKALMSDKKRLREYRVRLSDVSWLMRQLAEKIARMANREDEVTGRFWEGRFKCQPLLDEAAILACAIYVDLNPIRAQIAFTPETSDFTSIQDRIEASMARDPDRWAGNQHQLGRPPDADTAPRDAWLAPIQIDERGEPGPRPSRNGCRASDKGFLPLSLQQYLQLVDWTGRQLAAGKRGRIPAKFAPILQRLGLDLDHWCDLVNDFGRLFRRVAGNRASLAKSADKAGLQHRQASGGPALMAGA